MAAVPVDLQAVAHKLLSGDFDINLLDQIVAAAYDPISPHRAQANKALMQLQEAPDLWQMADTIIDQSQNPNSRFFGLQVLDDAIKTRYVTDFLLAATPGARRGYFTSNRTPSISPNFIAALPCEHSFLQMEDNTAGTERGDQELRGWKSNQNVVG